MTVIVGANCIRPRIDFAPIAFAPELDLSHYIRPRRIPWVNLIPRANAIRPYGIPFGMGDSAPIVQYHFAIFDMSVTAYPVMATQGDEIQARWANAM